MTATPTRTSPVNSAAVSVNGDDEQGDTICANAGLGAADAGADGPSTEHPNAPNAPVPMDEGPPPTPPVPGGTGKRRCVEANVGPPSVEAVSAGRGHDSADQCRSLISVLNERLEDHQSICEANLAHGDLDGSLHSGEENSG